MFKFSVSLQEYSFNPFRSYTSFNHTLAFNYHFEVSKNPPNLRAYCIGHSHPPWVGFSIPTFPQLADGSRHVPYMRF